MISSVYGYVNILSDHWLHNPLLRDDYGMTVAMLAALNNNLNILPTYW